MITIIVLVILAGVSINLMFGQYGIVTRAKEAKGQIEVARIREEIQLKLVDLQAEKMLTGGSVTRAEVEAIVTEAGGEVVTDNTGKLTGIKIEDTIIPIEEIIQIDGNLEYTDISKLNYTIDGTNLTIRGLSDKTVKVLNLAPTYEIGGVEYTVTKLCNMAFIDDVSLTKVYLPATLLSVNESNFDGENYQDFWSPFIRCYNLTQINVDSESEYFCSVDGVLYTKDMTTLICYPVGKTNTHLIIPEGVTTLGEGSIYGATHLIGITYPSTLVYDSADYRFMYLVSTEVIDNSNLGSHYPYCDLLTDDGIYIKNNVVVGINKDRITSNINIPEGITKIDSYAFENCKVITSVTIPNSVTYIANSAFSDCTNLTNVTIPDSVSIIEHYAFDNVPHITYNGTATGSPWGALSIN